MEVREWRSVAIGYAVGVIVVVFYGLTWWAPVAAIGATLAAYSLWR
jgi:hypothetical protein